MYSIKFGTHLSNNKEEWGQFSDFMNLFVSLINVIITGGIAWFIYVLQRKDQNAEKLKAENQLQKEKLVYLIGLINRSIKISRGIVENLIGLEDEFKGKPINLPTFKQISAVDLKILSDKIDRSEYYFPYKVLVKQDNFFEVFALFDNINGNYAELIRSENSILNSDYKLQKKNKKIVDNLIEELGEHLNDLKKNNLKQERDYIVFNSILYNYQINLEENPENLFFIREVVYDPLLTYLVRETKKFEEDRFRKLALLTRDANKSLSSITYNRDKRQGNIKEMRLHFEKTLLQVEKEVSVMLSLNFSNE